MARFNEILAGRFNRGLQKLTAIKGAAPVSQLASEIIPVIPLFHGVENRYLDGWQTFGTSPNLAASAANEGGFRFRNPIGSNVVAVFERIEIQETTADHIALRWGQPTVDLASVVALVGNRFDFRGQQASTLIFSSQNTAPTVPVMANQFSFSGPFIAANTPYNYILTIDQELPLLPGDGLQIESLTVNQAIQVAVKWRERFLEDSERT